MKSFQKYTTPSEATTKIDSDGVSPRGGAGPRQQHHLHHQPPRLHHRLLEGQQPGAGMDGSLLALTLVYLRVTHLIIPLQLFVSKRSVFDGKKAIRGGVPFVFPIFGPSSVMPQHGFARISRLKYNKLEFHG